MRQAQHLEAQTEMRVRDLRTMERVRRRVGRAVIGEDDLALNLAVAKELSASPEAFLDATRLVIGR
jgi:hypothetical protein